MTCFASDARCSGDAAAVWRSDNVLILCCLAHAHGARLKGGDVRPIRSER